MSSITSELAERALASDRSRFKIQLFAVYQLAP